MYGRVLKGICGRRAAFSHTSLRQPVTLLIAFGVLLGSSPGYSQPPPLPGEISNAAPDELLEWWPQANRTSRQFIFQSLIARRETALPILRQKLLTGSDVTKELALRIISEVRDAAALQTVLQVARDEVSDLLRTRAWVTIGKIGDTRAVPMLRQALVTGDDPRVVQGMLFAIGALGSTEDLTVVRPWLSSDDALTRVQAAIAMAQLGSAEAESVILSATYSADPLITKRATEGLGHLNTIRARDRLKEIIDSPRGVWKSYARIAVLSIDLRSLPHLERQEFLKRVIADPNDRVALWAVEQMAELPGTHAFLKSLVEQGGGRGERAARLIAAGRTKR